MHPHPSGVQVYGLRCIRCGTALDLPADARVVHIDCRYCGQDNVLPQDLIQARQRQHELYEAEQARLAEEHARAQAVAERAKAQQHKTNKLLLVIFGGGFVMMALLGTCVTIGYLASEEDEALKVRAQDPKVNGQAAMLARFEKMRQEQKCARILVQPTRHYKADGPISLDMVANDQCVHILGETGSSASLSMIYSGSVAFTSPLPPPGPNVDFRLCASQTGNYPFSISATPQEPFTVAAIECPRLPTEGGSRAKPDDPMTTGKTRVNAQMAQLIKAGCKGVVAEPQISRGPQTFTLTSPPNAPCFNMLITSYYSDVRFNVSLKDPDGKDMAVPSPSQEMRVAYCPTKPGKYEVSVTPSSGDHFAHASVDCPRNGPEGVRRLKALLARGD